MSQSGRSAARVATIVIVTVVGIGLAVVLVFFIAVAGMWGGSVGGGYDLGPPPSYEVDTSQCVQPSSEVRAAIQSSLRIGAVETGELPADRSGEDLDYLIRLDRANIRNWSAIETHGEFSALWIGVEMDVAQSWALNQPGASWQRLNEQTALDLYVLTSSLDGTERLYVYRDDARAYKTRVSTLDESRRRIEAVGGWDEDALASLAACLGYDATDRMHSDWSPAWMWSTRWYAGVNEPRG